MAMLIVAPLFGACASMPTGPGVMVLPGTGKSIEQFNADDTACRQWGFRSIGVTPGETAKYSGQEAQWRYDMAYMQCMYASGNQVPGSGSQGAYRSLPAPVPPPPAPSGSPSSGSGSMTSPPGPPPPAGGPSPSWSGSPQPRARLPRAVDCRHPGADRCRSHLGRLPRPVGRRRGAARYHRRLPVRRHRRPRTRRARTRRVDFAPPSDLIARSARAWSERSSGKRSSNGARPGFCDAIPNFGLDSVLIGAVSARMKGKDQSMTPWP